MLTRAIEEKTVSEEDPEGVPQRFSTNVAGNFAIRECTLVPEILGEWDSPFSIAGCGVNAAWYMQTNKLRTS